MINAIIIEDEKASMNLLIQALTDVAGDVQVSAMIPSVEEGLRYFANEPEADIIFSDVQLGDGYSFDIFKNSKARIPVVFITGYNEFMVNAFSHNGIDYLLKPVNSGELAHSLNKYRMLEQHFSTHNEIMHNLVSHLEGPKKTRIIVRRGLEYINLRLEDVVLFYTKDKISYVIDRWGKKYVSDKKLSELELQLDSKLFFRANRQYMINIEFVRSFKSYEKVKLWIDLTVAIDDHPIVISQENAPNFREWIFSA